MRQTTTADGRPIPVIGQGTWQMGQAKKRRPDEVAAIRLGLDLGMSLIDTAEMYGSGRAEEIVAEAIAGRRDDVFIVTKVLPENASKRRMPRALERSLARLKVECVDLYLLHWESEHPMEEILDSFVKLRDAGKIRSFGVSNIDVPLLTKTRALPGGDAIAADQVLYNPMRRGIERKLLGLCRDSGMLVMAYSPLEQGRLDLGGVFKEIAAERGVAPSTVALAWAVRHAGVVAVPKAVKLEHVRANAAAGDFVLDAAELARIDEAYPAPTRDVPLAVI